MSSPGSRTICLIVNEGSGRVKNDPAAIDAVREVLGDHAAWRSVESGGDIEAAAKKACEEGFDVIVPMGGDGTIMTVAGVAAGLDCALGILPMGTFNYFARGLGLPDDPAEAAEILLTGEMRSISVGEVNGRVFLNNASLGVYPKILRARESVYRRFGRRRIAAYWSVVKTFFRFQRPLRLTIESGDDTDHFRTPLLFVARSSFQLNEYELAGADCVDADRFAVFAAPDGTRLDLFRQAWRLVLRNMQPGEDFSLRCHDAFTVTSTRKHALVACDGEKFVMDYPLEFRMRKDALKIIAPTG